MGILGQHRGWELDLWAICGYNVRMADALRCINIRGKRAAEPLRGEGTTAVTHTHDDDKPGFVAEELEHCFACFRPIRPGQIYHLTIEFEVLCADCALSEDVIPVRDDLPVEAKRDRLLVQRGNVEVEVFAGEIRHRVAAVADAAAELAEVLALGGKAARPTPDLDMPKRKERNDGRRGAYQAVSSR